jgi:hypothetical protein
MPFSRAASSASTIWREIVIASSSGSDRFALEASHVIGIVCKCSGQNLQRNVATELTIARTVDLAHAACADGRDDLVEESRRACSDNLESCQQIKLLRKRRRLHLRRNLLALVSW